MTVRKGTRPKPTLVLLVRHGRTPTTGVINYGRAPGLHLSDDGRREAQATAERLRALRLSAVYASPLERARETAAPIAEAHRLEVQVEHELIDSDCGQWSGVALKELTRRPEWRIVRWHPSRFRFPGGESFTEIQARITEALERLVQRHPGEVIVAVSHADPIKLAVAHTLGIPLDLFQRIAISTGSITAIAHRPEWSVALTVNSLGGDMTVVQPT